MVWSHIYVPDADHCGVRRPPSAALSSDEGKGRRHEIVLENDEGRTDAYPIVYVREKKVHLTYYIESSPVRVGTEGVMMISLTYGAFPVAILLRWTTA